jgi:molybdopterin-binding protein
MRGYRIPQAAEVLAVSDDTIRRWIESGRILTAQESGRTIVPAKELARQAEHLAEHPEREGERARRVSARNRLAGIVTKVVSDQVMSQVELICGPYRVVSLMSTEAVHELGLEPGALATASIKATNVVVERNS